MTGNYLTDKIIMLVSVLLSLLTLLFFIYTEVLFEKEPPSNDEGMTALQKESTQNSKPQDYELKKMVVNLKTERNRLRFLEIETHLIVFKEKQLKLLEKNEAIINDTIIDVGSRLTAEELNTVAGKILLGSRIKNHLNKSFGTPVIKDILFSSFVIQ